jgi:aryl-alcohol dehydrogenase-like predicted oxidoreductase
MVTDAVRSRDDLEDNDFRRLMPRFSEENFPKNLALVEEIGRIARQKGCTPSQLALAWLLAQGPDVFPIPGTTRVERLRENLGALRVELAAGEERALRRACEAADVRGERYPEIMMVDLFVDTVPVEA